MIFRAHATRGLRKKRMERPDVLLARRGPTIARWSLDARSKGQSGHSLLERNKRAWRDHLSPRSMAIVEPTLLLCLQKKKLTALRQESLILHFQKIRS